MKAANKKDRTTTSDWPMTYEGSTETRAELITMKRTMTAKVRDALKQDTTRKPIHISSY